MKIRFNKLRVYENEGCFAPGLCKSLEIWIKKRLEQTGEDE